MPAPTQQPIHLASAGFGAAMPAAAILAVATRAVIVLRMTSSKILRDRSPETPRVDDRPNRGLFSGRTRLHGSNPKHSLFVPDWAPRGVGDLGGANVQIPQSHPARRIGRWHRCDDP